MADAHISSYLTELGATLRSGEATEHSYWSALKGLLERLAADVRATNEPKRVQCGAPDFVLTRGEVPLGYIETKDVGADLAKWAESKQLRRYREGLPNLILTDYLDFHWYAAGELRLTARVACLDAAGTLRPDPAGSSAVLHLLQAFLNGPAFPIASPEELARRLAAAAQLVREAIARALEAEGGEAKLREQLSAFQKVLLHDLSPAQFADMYAQTICYGLFSARFRHQGPAPFTRQIAPYDLPKTNPFLRWLFGHIAGPELDERIAWIVDAVAEMLNRADMAAGLHGFGQGHGREDAVFHFYETFLAAYDPALRKGRGVYYTPQPVVGHIVACVDELLRQQFGLVQGLADSSRVATGKQGAETHRVLILDPAAGTGAFLDEVVRRVRLGFEGNEGLWPGYVERHLLPRLFGFELLMAPYTVAHFKLGLQLEATGYKFASDERLRVYLTNTLEEAHELPGLPIFTQQLAHEANAASVVKRDSPVIVILGNPPYAGHSANAGRWITELLHGHDQLTGRATQNYFEVDGAPLRERNVKWLNDDYVKFLRFGQWRIERTGYGILAFITNNGYLENPTFRGMRQALMATFDQIYIVNLHGDSKKRERAPDGGKDENVFDIQQGVAIGIFVKTGGPKPRKPVVRCCDVWGERQVKYAWLASHTLATAEWRKATPRAPNYLFAPQVPDHRREYERGWLLTEAMPVNVLGFQTHRDDFAIAFSKKTIAGRVAALRDRKISDEQLRSRYELRDSNEWRLAEARKKIRSIADAHAAILEILYRPFDRRWCQYDAAVVDRPRAQILEHIAGRPNLCLNTVRQTRMASWRHALVSDCPAPAVYVELKDGCNIFPLYLYDGRTNGHLFYAADREIAGVNFAPVFLEAVAAATGLRYVGVAKEQARGFTAEQLFRYMYAVLNAPSFAARYGEHLRRGWPRVPLTGSAALFRRLSGLGGELIACHLLRAPEAGATFPVAGRNRVERVAYSDQRVWINERQYFQGVAASAWEAMLGGYRPAEQWLKDRAGSELDFDAINTYCHLIAGVEASLGLQARIDRAIPAWPLP